MKKNLWLSALLLLIAVGKTWGITAEQYYQAGLRLYDQRDYSRSLDYFNAAVRLDENHWQAYQGISYSYYRLGRTREALEACDRSLALHPENENLRKFSQAIRANHAISTLEIPLGLPPSALEPDQDTGLEALSQPRVLHFNFVSKGTKGSERPWLKFYGGYNHSQMGDLTTALHFWQSYFQSNGYSVTPSLDNSGLALGTEFGLALDEKNSISLSMDFVNSGNYSIHADNEALHLQVDQDISPFLLAPSVNYYRYFSSKNNRFYVGLGLGYAEALVHYKGPMGPSGENEDVDLWGGGLQGSIQIGEEFILVDSLVLEFSIKGRYAYISKVETSLPSGPAALAALPVGNTLLVDDGYAASNGYHYSAIDFTGPDVKLSLNIYF